MGMEVGRIDLGLDVNQKAFNNQLNGLSSGAMKSTKSAFSGLGTKIGVVLGMAAIASFTKSCLELGSSLTEVQNVVDTTFTQMSGSVNSFASAAMEQFGLSETVAKKYMGTLGAMSKSMGFTEGQSYDMAKSITGLTGDVASFYNLSGDEAYTKLKSIWTGETESLKDLGVVMTQANLDQYALNNGFGKTTAKMTEQEKTMLRFQYVMSSLSAAQGDFAKTSDSWANQTRVLGLRFDSLRATLGQGFISLFSPIIIMINTLLSKLQVLANGFKLFTESITGKKAQGATGVLTDISSGAIDAASDLSGIGSAAESSAKQAEKALMGFDKITKIGDASGENGAAGAATGNNVAVTPEITPPDTSNTESVVAKLMAALEPLRNINFDPLKNAFGELKNAISPLADKVWEGLGWAYKNILVPLATWTVEDALPAFFQYWASELTVFNSVLDALKPLASWLWDSFLNPIATWTGGLLIDSLNITADALYKVSGWIDNNQETFRAMAVTVGIFGAVWKGIDFAVFLTNAGGVIGILGKMKAAIMACTVAKIKDQIVMLQIIALYAKDAAAKVASKIATVATTVATTAMTVAQGALNLVMSMNPISLIIIAIVALIAGIVLLYTKCEWFRNVVGVIFEAIKYSIQTAINFVIGLFNAVVDFVSNNWQGLLLFLVNPFAGAFKLIYDNCEWFRVIIDSVINAVVGFFLWAWDSIKAYWSGVGAFFGGVWEGIMQVFSNVSNWFGGTFATAWTAVKNVFSTGGEIFSGIVDGIADSFKKVVNAIISGVNWIIALPFDKINGMLNKIRDVSFLGVSPFEDMWGYNPLPVPKIPMLAQGGYVGANQPQLAMIGDNRHEGEIVSPESKFQAAINEAVSLVSKQSSGLTEAAIYRAVKKALAETSSDIYLDGKSVKDAVVTRINQSTRATGVCEINV